MAGEAERHHPFRIAVARSAMMHRNRPLSTLEGGTSWHAAAIAISGKHLFAVPPKVLLVLPSERIANGAQPARENTVPTARATHRTLENAHHQLTCPCQIVGIVTSLLASRYR